MSNIVYLISSLSSLTFEQVPPLSLEDFHSEAKAQLSIRNFDSLKKMDLKNINETGPRNLNKFIEVLKQLQTDLIEIRNAKISRSTPNIDILPKNIIEQNPLEREKSILKWQWEQLTNIEASETFTFTEVLVYKLKLQILHRLHSFQSEKGREILESIVQPSQNIKEKQ